MKSLGLSFGIAGLVVLSCFQSLAQAGQPLVLEADQSQMLAVPSEPGAVVVGNPSIADVTTHGDKILVHARAFGETNLLILDQQGNQIAAFDVMIRHTTKSTLALFKGTSRMSYSCAPLCEGEMQVGDDPRFFEAIAGAAKDKKTLASNGLGQDDPNAPQNANGSAAAPR